MPSALQKRLSFVVAAVGDNEENITVVGTQKLRGIGHVILSYCVTGYHFGADSLDVRLCRVFTRRLPYSDLRYCVTSMSHSQLRIGPLPDEETCDRRVYLWRVTGFGI